MNASAYLHNQGWRGAGFSLDHSNRGLAKPLLVSHKTDLAGLGTKKNDFGNQWWTTAFDKSLKDFGNTKDLASTVIQKPSPGKQQGLYASFVKAQTLESTIKDIEEVAHSPVDTTPSKSIMPPKIESTLQFGVLGVPPSKALEYYPVEDEQTPTKRERKRKRNSEDDTTSNVDDNTAAKHQKKKSKKRKRDNELEATAKSEAKKAKRLKRKMAKEEKSLNKSGIVAEKNAEPLLHGPSAATMNGESAHDEEDYIQIGEPGQMAQENAQKKKKNQESASEIRKRRKAERKAKSREHGILNKERKQQENGANPAVEPTPDPARELRRPLHPESIMSLREIGQGFELPGDKGDEDLLRFRLIQCIERGKKGEIKGILNRAMNPDEKPKAGKSSAKKQKLERENKKRQAKRDAKHWVEVRANTHMYRPDGSYIQPKDRGVSVDELRAKAQAEKDLRRAAVAKKEAEKQAKESAKVRAREEKLARKEKRREEKKLLKALPPSAEKTPS